MTLMFEAFLTLEFEKLGKPSDKRPIDELADKMRKDYDQWRIEYVNEVGNEKPENGAISEPLLRQAVTKFPDLWESVSPAVFVVDYISEMTDRFVVHDVSRDMIYNEYFIINWTEDS